MGFLDYKLKNEVFGDCTVMMISGCQDKQTSADVGNVASSFRIPDPAGLAGGACTSVLLQVLYADEKKPEEEELTFTEVLERVRRILQHCGYQQIPQLSSNHCIQVTQPFHLVPTSHHGGGRGTRRALMIGINYVGHKQGELHGCHNDVVNMKVHREGERESSCFILYSNTAHCVFVVVACLLLCCRSTLWTFMGFRKKNITVLMDDGKHYMPTKRNMIAAYRRIVAESMPGDAIFCIIPVTAHKSGIPMVMKRMVSMKPWSPTITPRRDVSWTMSCFESSFVPFGMESPSPLSWIVAIREPFLICPTCIGPMANKPLWKWKRDSTFRKCLIGPGCLEE